MQGKSINGFTLQRQLGIGGMAEVWYAENEIHKAAAVKILNEDLSHNANIVERFRNEAEIMVKLDHPNIRQVYGYGTIDGRPSIVMEYLEGSDMKAMMKRGRRFTSEELEKWWNQMADALNYTHAENIIHRDIKPSNIFIDKKGNVKLLDFGIAKVRESISMTQTGAMMGTLMYMSPEQVQDSKHLDYRTDIYSLAVTFVHLLTGKAPYDTTTSNDFQIREGIVYKPLDMTGVPEGWKGFLMPYLEKEPAKRPALRPFEAVALVDPIDEGTVVPDVAVPVQTQPKAQVAQKKVPEPVTEETPGGGKSKKGLWIVLALALAAIVAVALFVLMKPDPETEAFKACKTVKDYRGYLSDYGRTSKHYAEAKQFVDQYVADSTAKAKELLAQQQAKEKAEAEAKAKAEAEKKEEEAYSRCNTIADCEKYLKDYPNGRYVQLVTEKKSLYEEKARFEAEKKVLQKQQQSNTTKGSKEKTIPTQGLIAYYPFDGNANDMSGNGKHATPQNDYYYDNGVLGQAIKMTGKGYETTSNVQGGHVLLPQLDFGNSGFTINLWVKAEGLSKTDGETYINFGYDTDKKEQQYILQNQNSIIFSYHDASISVPFNTKNVWTMYTLTCTRNGELVAYVNGKKVGEKSVSYDGVKNTSMAAIGRHWWSNGRWSSARFIGSIDEVRLYNRAISEKEIGDLYKVNRE